MSDVCCKLTLAAGLDGFNRVLACRDTFLTDLVHEALALGRFDRSLVEALDRDIEMAVGAVPFPQTVRGAVPFPPKYPPRSLLHLLSWVRCRSRRSTRRAVYCISYRRLE